MIVFGPGVVIRLRGGNVDAHRVKLVAGENTETCLVGPSHLEGGCLPGLSRGGKIGEGCVVRGEPTSNPVVVVQPPADPDARRAPRTIMQFERSDADTFPLNGTVAYPGGVGSVVGVRRRDPQKPRGAIHRLYVCGSTKHGAVGCDDKVLRHVQELQSICLYPLRKFSPAVREPSPTTAKWGLALLGVLSCAVKSHWRCRAAPTPLGAATPPA